MKNILSCFRFVSENWLNTITQSAAWQTPISKDFREIHTNARDIFPQTQSPILSPRAFINYTTKSPVQWWTWCGKIMVIITSLWTIIILPGLSGGSQMFGPRVTTRMKCQTFSKYFLFLPWFDDRDKDHSLSIQNYVKVQDGNWKLSGYTFSICQRWNVGTIPGYLQGEIIKDQPILWRLDQT